MRLAGAPPSMHKLSRSTEQRTSSKRPLAGGDEKKPPAKVRKVEGSSSRTKEERREKKRGELPPTTPPVQLPEFVARSTFASLKNFKIPKVVDEPAKTSQEATSATEAAPAASQPATSQQLPSAPGPRPPRESTHREASQGPPSRDGPPWDPTYPQPPYGHAPFSGPNAPVPDLQRRPIRSILKNSGSSHANYAPAPDPIQQGGPYPPGPPHAGPPGQGPPPPSGYRRKPLLPDPGPRYAYIFLSAKRPKNLDRHLPVYRG